MIVDLRRYPRVALLLIWILGYFDPDKWAVWSYAATIVGDGTNAGNHSYEFTPGEGNVCILIAGSVLQGDPTSRNVQVLARNGDDTTFRRILSSASVAQDKRRQFPTSEATSDDGSSSDGQPIILSGVEDLLVNIASLANSENTAIEIQMLVSGGPPTVVITSPGVATETETENRIV